MKQVVIKICNIYVLEINEKEFIRAETKEEAKRFSKTEAVKVSKPWKGNVTFEEVDK